MTNEQLRSALALLASQQAKLVSKHGFWERIGLFMPLATGIMVAVAGALITEQIKEGQAEAAKTEREYQQRVARTELLSKFLPFLNGNSDQVSMAVVAISLTGDAELMNAVAQMTVGKGGEEGLERVVSSVAVTEIVRDSASQTLEVMEASKLIALLPGGQSLGLVALKVAFEELSRGVAEQPRGSNRGIRVDRYNQEAGIDIGTPWGANFAVWCFNTAAKRLGKRPLLKGTPLSSDLMSQLQEIGRWKTKNSGYEPKPGDLMIVRTGQIQHQAGVVLSVDAQAVVVIEGNTNDGLGMGEKGNRVTLQTRRRSSILGYGDMSF